MSAITVAPRIRCKRPVVAKKPPRRIGDGVFRTIVEMAYEMASCEWRDAVIEQLTPLFRSVKAYADKPKRLNGKSFPPLRREEGWVKEIYPNGYSKKLDSYIIAKHEYISASPTKTPVYLDVTIHRGWAKQRKDKIEYHVIFHIYHRGYSLAVDGSMEENIYLDFFNLNEAEEELRNIPNKNYTLIR